MAIYNGDEAPPKKVMRQSTIKKYQLIFDTWKKAGTPSYAEIQKTLSDMGINVTGNTIKNAITVTGNRNGWGKFKSKA